MSSDEKLAAFIAETQSHVRRVGEEFDKPDDDWIQIAVLQSEEGTHLVVMANEMFASDFSKDALAECLKTLMDQTRAERYAVLFNVHGLLNPSDQDWEEHRRGRRLADFPNAYEMLLLIAGDAEQEFGFRAHIKRDGVSPPTLDEWEQVPHIEGRFANLNARMRKVGVA